MKRAVSILLMVVIIIMCVNVSAQTDVKVTLDGNEVYLKELQANVKRVKNAFQMQ